MATPRPSAVVRSTSDAALGAVVHLEHRVGGKVAAEHSLEHPAGITRRWFQLDHVGSPVGEDAAG